MDESWYRITGCRGDLAWFVKAFDSFSAIKDAGYDPYSICQSCFDSLWRATECELSEVVAEDVHPSFKDIYEDDLRKV